MQYRVGVRGRSTPPPPRRGGRREHRSRWSSSTKRPSANSAPPAIQRFS